MKILLLVVKYIYMHYVKPLALYDLVAKGERKTYEKGEILQSYGENINLSYIKSGYIKRYLIRNDGSLGVQSVYGTGYIFPLTFAFKALLDTDLSGGPDSYNYEAMTPTQVFSINKTTLVNAVNEQPLLYKDLFIVSGERLRSNIQRLENISLNTFYKRVAHQMLFFAREFGIEIKSGVKIMVPLTQQDIADILNATRETVSVSVSLLKKKGLLLAGKNYIVPDMQQLAKEAYS